MLEMKNYDIKYNLIINATGIENNKIKSIIVEDLTPEEFNILLPKLRIEYLKSFEKQDARRCIWEILAKYEGGIKVSLEQLKKECYRIYMISDRETIETDSFFDKVFRKWYYKILKMDLNTDKKRGLIDFFYDEKRKTDVIVLTKVGNILADLLFRNSD